MLLRFAEFHVVLVEYLLIGSVLTFYCLLPLDVHLEVHEYQQLFGYQQLLRKFVISDVGIVVFRSINFVNTPPIVSIPRESGVTSRRTTSFTSPVKYSTLNSCSHCYNFIRVYAFMRFFTCFFFNCFLYSRNTS